jgi:hypothetical protein
VHGAQQEEELEVQRQAMEALEKVLQSSQVWFQLMKGHQRSQMAMEEF